MKKQNMVGFRINMYTCENPQKLYKQLRPDNCLQSIWIPQTIGDQIWMWFEFKDKEDKKAYIKWVKACDIVCKDFDGKEYYPKNMFMHGEKWLTQKEIDHWTKY